MTAWSYRHLHNYPASFAVDRNVHFNAFASWLGETYPWLALDLHYPRLVSRIIIIEKDNTSLNIETFLSRPEGRRVVHLQQSLWRVPGTFQQVHSLHHLLLAVPGGEIRQPAEQGQVQQVIPPSGSLLSWTEVVLDAVPLTLPSGSEKVLNILTRNPVTQCPGSHPFAFRNGSKCCETNLREGFIKHTEV